MNGFPAREQVDVGVVEVVGVGLGAPDQSARPETVLAGCQSSLCNRADGTFLSSVLSSMSSVSSHAAHQPSAIILFYKLGIKNATVQSLV